MLFPVLTPAAPLSASRDCRTTPSRLRLPVLLGLGLMAIWYLLCARSTAASLGVMPKLDLPKSVQKVLWLGHFRMFTELRPVHSVVWAEVRRGPQWTTLDLAELFPSGAQAGPGYERASFYGSPKRMRALARAVCASQGEPPGVRFWRTTWDKQPGQAAQPQVGAAHEALGQFQCGGL